MNHLELLRVTGLFIFSLLSFVLLGKRIIGKKDDQIEHYGAYLGLGTIIYGSASLILGIFHQFTQVNLYILLLVAFIVGISKFKFPKLNIKLDWFSLGLLIVAMGMLFTTYLSAMQPPHTSDELNYHFPQAQKIVDDKRVDLRFGGHYFYGNIPKQMEVIFASGIALSGYSYAHSLHFMFLIALVLVVWGIFYKQYGARTASLGVLFLFMYDDLIWNVTSGFVDGASFCLEIMGLLFALKYIANRENRHDLIISGLMIGAGLTIKYSVAVTALYISLLLLPRVKQIGYFVIPAIIAGGFWYIKNIVWFINPFYPMYLGHPGVTNNEYASLMAAIQQFGPKTLSYFRHLMEYFKEIQRLPIYFALLIAPLSIFIKKSSNFTRLLLVYFLLYVPYWFYVGTHQMRFFALAAILALLLSAIVIGSLRMRYLIVGFVVLAALMWRTPYYDQTVLSFFSNTKFHLTERQYGLGNLTRDEFLHRWFGCYYDSIIWLNTQEDNGIVVDNWSYGTEANIPFYSQGHEYIAWSKMDLEQMRKSQIKYMYTRDKSIAQFTGRKEDSFTLSSPVNIKFESFFVTHSTLVKQIDDCRIYSLNP